MASACLTLYETTFDLRFFREARTLCDDLIRLFGDPDGGGFFQTGVDAEALVVRPKDLYDNAVPSGNSAAAEVLQRMALFTGEATYEQAGTSALRLVRKGMETAPTGFGTALCALDLYVGPSYEVAIAGDPSSSETRALAHEVFRARFLPNIVLAAGMPDERLARVVPLMAGRRQSDGHATAYVCERFACRTPVTMPPDLAAQLTASRNDP
jgi:uncharacterized protein YyaL (SSP411 family)